MLFSGHGEEFLDPGDTEQLEEEAAQYNEEDGPLLIALTKSDAPKKDDVLTEDIQRLQNAVSSLAIQMQQWQPPQKPLEPSEWVSKLNLRRTPSVIAGLDPPPSPPPPFEGSQPVIAVVQSPSGLQPLSLTQSLLYPLQATIQQAIERGEDTQSFHLACPVFEEGDAQGQQGRVHGPS